MDLCEHPCGRIVGSDSGFEFFLPSDKGRRKEENEDEEELEHSKFRLSLNWEAYTLAKIFTSKSVDTETDS